MKLLFFNIYMKLCYIVLFMLLSLAPWVVLLPLFSAVSFAFFTRFYLYNNSLQVSELLMVLLNPVLVSLLWVFYVLTWSWSVLYPLLWLVFWVFMVLLSLFYYLVDVSLFFFKTQYFPRLTFSTVAMKQTLFSGFVQMAAGLSVGLSCLAGKINYIYIWIIYWLLSLFIAGIAIGITGDAGVRATAQQPRMFVGMVNRLKQ